MKCCKIKVHHTYSFVDTDTERSVLEYAVLWCYGETFGEIALISVVNCSAHTYSKLSSI